MSPHVPLVSSRKALAAFRRLGFEVSHRQGSHITLVRVHEDGGKDVTVLPDAKAEIPRWTLKSALDLARVEPEEFMRALR